MTLEHDNHNDKDNNNDNSYDDKLLNDDYNDDNGNDKYNPSEVEGWSRGLFEKYENLRKITLSNIPKLWSGLEFALSVRAILNIKIVPCRLVA